jgi:hypothetical protein
MSEVTAFLAHQPLVIQTALYAGALLFLLGAGGTGLMLIVGALDRIGAALTSDPDWQPRGETSKQETLLLIGVLIYAQLLITFEPPLRAFASVAGNPLVTSLMLAPIAGALLYERLLPLPLKNG